MFEHTWRPICRRRGGGSCHSIAPAGASVVLWPHIFVENSSLRNAPPLCPPVIHVRPRHCSTRRRCRTRWPHLAGAAAAAVQAWPGQTSPVAVQQVPAPALAPANLAPPIPGPLAPPVSGPERAGGPAPPGRSAAHHAPPPRSRRPGTRSPCSPGSLFGAACPPARAALSV